MATRPARRFFHRRSTPAAANPPKRQKASADARSSILLFDIESTNLDADIGTCLAFGFKFYGEKETKVISLLDTNPVCPHCHALDATNDAALMRQIYDVLASARIWVSWYGKRFDIPFLNSRMVEAGLRPLPPIPHVDLWQTARRTFALTNNRLATFQQFLRLQNEKTPLDRRIWRRAAAGSPEDIGYVITHCRQDVMVLEDAYNDLRPYVKNHPRVSAPKCRTCGSDQTEITTLGPVGNARAQRVLVCGNCGAQEPIAA